MIIIISYNYNTKKIIIIEVVFIFSNLHSLWNQKNGVLCLYLP